MLLSVHPRHAASILAGSKTVELRRQRVAVPAGTVMVLYATAPTKAIVGTALILGVHTDTPQRVWTRYRGKTGITRKEYDDYMLGSSRASAVLLTDAREIDKPIPLEFLRSHQKFQPPQSYRYIGIKELWDMVTDHASADELMACLSSAALTAT